MEWVATLPVLALLVVGVLAIGGIVRDVMVLQEAARVGARVASVTPGSALATAAARQAAPEVDGVTVTITPSARRTGDDVQVVLRATRTYGPLSVPVTARSTARTEPIVDGAPHRTTGGWTDPTGEDPAPWGGRP